MPAESPEVSLYLSVGEIRLYSSGRDGSLCRLESTLLSDTERDDPESKEYVAAIDAIESLVLAQFAAGLDLTTPTFREALETALQVVGNHLL